MRTRGWKWIGTLAAATLTGYALVQLALPADRSAGAGPVVSRALATPEPATPLLGAGRPSRVARPTEQDAIDAAVRYLRALEPGSEGAGRRALIGALTVAPLTAQALQAQAASAALWQKLSSGGPALARGWPLGYRIDAYSPSRARVTVWAVGLVASAGEVVAPTWSETTCTLQWHGGAWRVSAATTTPGPTPPSSAADPQMVGAFVRSATRFRSFGDAP